MKRGKERKRGGRRETEDERGGERRDGKKEQRKNAKKVEEQRVAIEQVLDIHQYGRLVMFGQEFGAGDIGMFFAAFNLARSMQALFSFSPEIIIETFLEILSVSV